MQKIKISKFDEFSIRKTQPVSMRVVQAGTDARFVSFNDLQSQEIFL
jgi:hypothetical protein